MKYYRLNYQISDWLPKGSIWSRDSEGYWNREDKPHTMGQASEGYWFTQLLEQESVDPSAHNSDDDLDILTEVVQGWQDKE